MTLEFEIQLCGNRAEAESVGGAFSTSAPWKPIKGGGFPDWLYPHRL